MKKLNPNLYKITDENTFKSVTQTIHKYQKQFPNKKIISLGVGDVSLPIIPPIISSMHKAVDDLSNIQTFKGYGAYCGYNFLKEKILDNDYQGFNFKLDEIYISNGTKTDVSNILELFPIDAKICLSSIMYPIYKDGATCLNRQVSILKANKNNSFLPDIPQEKYDLIYLCSPSNPLGIAYSYEQLNQWVTYALKNDSVILYDNVYFPFINSTDKPKSIYQIKNAKKVAIEFRSFSKMAGFTGVRCSYFVIPKEIHKDINYLWQKRTINRFNGVDYIAQRGAEAYYLKESQELIKKDLTYYLENSLLLKESFLKMGFEVYGGIDSPYLWIKIKDNLKSMAYFNLLLKEINVIIIPGIVFGSDGDDYFRVSSLSSRQDINEAIKRLRDYYEQKN